MAGSQSAHNKKHLRGRSRVLRERLLEAIEFVVKEVLSDIARIDSVFAYSSRTVSVYHYTVPGEDHDTRYHILVTAEAETESIAYDCVLVTLERADTGQSVSDVGFYDKLVDRIL